MKRTPLKRSNPKRKAERFERNFGDRAADVRCLPCIVPGCWKGPIEAAHAKARGMGGVNSDNRQLVPLCRWHHSEQHTRGVITFQAKYGIDLEAEAKRVAEIVDLDLARPPA